MKQSAWLRLSPPLWVLIWLQAAWLPSPAVSQSPPPADLREALNAISKIDRMGQGHEAAQQALKVVSRAPVDQLPTLLAAIPADNPLAENWLRGAIQAVVQRGQQAGEPLPTSAVERFLADRGNAPQARQFAYQLITEANPEAGKAWIPKFLDDPCVELRRLAVSAQLDRADQQVESQRAEATESYRSALAAARDVDQINRAAESLKKLGQTVDLTAHYGFVTRWQLLGPFNNVDGVGYDQTFGPEEAVHLDQAYVGKDGQRVRWSKHQTDDEFGMVDLNGVLGPKKGAIAYAYAEIQSARDQAAEIRMGCITGSKVWVNGQLLMAYNSYHANIQIDQYRAPCKLKRGTNRILLKIAQNEQTENWAQRWQFQLRVCDAIGTAVGVTSTPAASGP